MSDQVTITLPRETAQELFDNIDASVESWEYTEGETISYLADTRDALKTALAAASPGDALDAAVTDEMAIAALGDRYTIHKKRTCLTEEENHARQLAAKRKQGKRDRERIKNDPERLARKHERDRANYQRKTAMTAARADAER